MTTQGMADRMITTARKVPPAALRRLRRARRAATRAVGRSGDTAGRGAGTGSAAGNATVTRTRTATPGSSATEAPEDDGNGALPRQVMASPRWRDGYARGKQASRSVRRHGDLGPVRESERLPQLLSEVMITQGLGREVSAERLERLRRLAIDGRSGDRTRSSLAALSLLAGAFDDPTAQSWLPVALADAGRFAQAADLEISFNAGRPSGSGYVLLVVALHQLGRHDDAEQLMRSLEEQFPALREDFVHIWDDDPVAAAYRRARDLAPAVNGVLPVFYHLPFCAGTSQLMAFRRVVPWARMMHISRWIGLLQIEDAMRLRAERTRQLMLVHLHHPYPLQLQKRRLSYFTMLRDPVSQLRSGFHKRQSANRIVSTRDADSETFGDHADYLIGNGLTNLLSRQLVVTHPSMKRAYAREFSSGGAFTAIGSEEDMFWLGATRKFSDEQLLRMTREALDQRFHAVGTMKHLHASHLIATAGVGVPLAKRLGHAGKSGQTRSEQPEQDPVAERLRDANSVDQQIYQEYTARFERDHADVIEAVNAEA